MQKNTDNSAHGRSRATVLGLSSLAAICFVGSLLTPFVCSDFNLDKFSFLNHVDSTARDPCGDVLGAIEKKMPGIKVPTTEMELPIPYGAMTVVCRATVGDGVKSVSVGLLDRVLGPMNDPMTGEKIGWGECLSKAESGVNIQSLGSCCTVGERPLDLCIKWWASTGGVPLGSRTLPGIIGGLFESGTIVLGVLVVLFSILFPLSKIVVTLIIGLGSPSPRLTRVLALTGKWSMADVFLVAMLITFFKADSLNFSFVGEVGIYLFAAAALLSSLAVSVLEKDEKRREFQ